MLNMKLYLGKKNGPNDDHEVNWSKSLMQTLIRYKGFTKSFELAFQTCNHKSNLL